MVNFPCISAFTWLHNEPRDIQITTVGTVIIVNALQGFKPLVELEYREESPYWINMKITLVFHCLLFLQIQLSGINFRNGRLEFPQMNETWYQDNINCWEQLHLFFLVDLTEYFRKKLRDMDQKRFDDIDKQYFRFLMKLTRFFLDFFYLVWVLVFQIYCGFFNNSILVL